MYFLLSINFPFLTGQGFWHRKKLFVPGEAAAKLATSRKAEEMAWSCVKWNLKLLFQWQAAKHKQHCQSRCHLSRVESSVEINRTNFHKLLFQTPPKQLCTPFCSLGDIWVVPTNLRSNDWGKYESRIFCNLGNAITRDTGGRKFQPREGKIEIIDLCSLGTAEAAGNMNLMKQPKLQWRIRSRKEGGWLQGETALPVSSRPLERCYQMRRQKTDQSRNQQLGENEQIRKEYVWLFCTWLMGEKRSLNLCRVRSPWVTWALQSSTIVLPEVFPSGWSKENNCFHHLLF